MEYKGRVYTSQIKSSESHGYYAEFVSRNSFHRVEIDKARLIQLCFYLIFFFIIKHSLLSIIAKSLKKLILYFKLSNS